MPSRAAAGGEVVQRHAKPVGAEEPRERLAHAPQIVPICRHHVRAAEREHEGGGVDGLLVGSGLFAAAAVPTGVAHQLQAIAVEADVLEKLERLARDAQRGALAGHPVGGEQRERQNGVVVGERRLEPAPVVGRVRCDSAPSSFCDQGDRAALRMLRRLALAARRLARPRMACAVPRGPSSSRAASARANISRASSRQPRPRRASAVTPSAQRARPMQSSDGGARSSDSVVAHEVAKAAVRSPASSADSSGTW